MDRTGGGRAPFNARTFRVEPAEGDLLTEGACRALRLAVSMRERSPLESCGALAALVALDTSSFWRSLPGGVGQVSLHDFTLYPDRGATAARCWRSIPLTEPMAEALTVAAQIADDHDLPTVDVGVLALGLIWDVDAGASRALLRDSSLAHEELVRLVEGRCSITLGTARY